MANPLEKLLRAGEGRLLRRLQQVAKAVNALEDEYSQLTDDELRDETAEFRTRYEAGETLDKLMPEAFAAVRADLNLLPTAIEDVVMATPSWPVRAQRAVIEKVISAPVPLPVLIRDHGSCLDLDQPFGPRQGRHHQPG